MEIIIALAVVIGTPVLGVICALPFMAAMGGSDPTDFDWRLEER